MSTTRVFPVGSTIPGPAYDGLDPESYTAQRLKHASPEHLHDTTRRFFIGPIPEGWLNSHRKSWYKRRLELSTYSSRAASFTAADATVHHRTLTGLDAPSTAARVGFSFPQPDDVDEEHPETGTTGVIQIDGPIEEPEVEDAEIDTEPTVLDPVSTYEAEEDPNADRVYEHRNSEPRAINGQRTLDGAVDQTFLSPESAGRGGRSHTEASTRSFRTAKEHPASSWKTESPDVKPQSGVHDNDNYDSDDYRPSISNAPESIRGAVASPYLAEISSKTALLPSAGGSALPEPAIKQGLKTMSHSDPSPMQDDKPERTPGRTSTGVRFGDIVAHRQHRFGQRVDRAKTRVSNRSLRRDTLREGTIVKMEKMLVRVDITMQEIPEDFDENESIRTEMRTVERWREFMVVARKSNKEELEDFRLQIYKSRVIPEIDDGRAARKKPVREIKLNPKTTHINMYSSLDKTIVIWHPYKRGTRVTLLRPSSAGHAVEWYTFLRDALGLPRPRTLQLQVPDLGVTLRLDRPFEELATAGINAKSEEEAIAKTLAAERAIANNIISKSLAMLEGNKEWTTVLKTWSDTVKLGLAWKRYDRLEWVHGMNEQQMYGSMAMQHSHDLQLRPKHHHLTHTHRKKGGQIQEPAPIEGFLIRLTSQKGVHKRAGKQFFKRLYFMTQNQFLIFNRPAKATPPHPPRLGTIRGRNIPSSSEIVEKSPIMYEIEPFEIQSGEIKWLGSGNRETIARRDQEAVEEARRNVENVTASDGYINMCFVVKVRPMRWGASPADDTIDSGASSDVDFHQDVADTRREDGATHHVDDDRVLELVLDNGLVIRLQAYNKQTRDEWITRLKDLVKYWKLRTVADMDIYKSVRRANLEILNIDEDAEALIGQFAKKWEVSRSQASPDLYNMCAISSCRTITMSGLLYLKPRRHSTFHRCGVILTGGQMLIYQATLRSRTGTQIKHTHQEKQEVIDLKNCYVYSGLIVEDDLLYQNRTFNANHPGMASLPRVWQEDGWTSSDVDVMTCFVVWMNRKKGWFRSVVSAAQDDGSSVGTRGRTKARLKRVAQLGVPGRAVVFKCRSRAERDHWVLAVASEIDRVVERETRLGEGPDQVRFDT